MLLIWHFRGHMFRECTYGNICISVLRLCLFIYNFYYKRYVWETKGIRKDRVMGWYMIELKIIRLQFTMWHSSSLTYCYVVMNIKCKIYIFKLSPAIVKVLLFEQKIKEYCCLDVVEEKHCLLDMYIYNDVIKIFP